MRKAVVAKSAPWWMITIGVIILIMEKCWFDSVFEYTQLKKSFNFGCGKRNTIHSIVCVNRMNISNTISFVWNLIPKPDPDKSYWFKGELPTLRGTVVGISDVFSTIHPNYLLVAGTFVFAFFILYIKMQYPFWNQVPAYHVYDWHRRFYGNPYIINAFPKKTKYYEREPIIATSRFQDISVEKRNELTRLLQNHYFPSDRVFCSIQLVDLEAQNRSSILSTFNRVEEQIETSGNKIEKTTSASRIEGFITSRPVNISVAKNDNGKKERLIILEPAEYIDTICFDKTAATLKNARCLFSTHEYNQRFLRPDNKISLFKKEVDLIGALVPLVQYEAFSFYMRQRTETRPFPKSWQLVRIQREHLNYLHDFMDRVASLKDPAGFKVSATMEIGEITTLLHTNQMFVYALRGTMDAVYALYFFRNPHMKYDDLEGADTLHFFMAFRNTDDFELFFAGFIWALREARKAMPEAKMLMMDDIGHSRPIVERWISTHDIVLRTPCAYYLTNYVVPGMPFSAGEALVIA